MMKYIDGEGKDLVWESRYNIYGGIYDIQCMLFQDVRE